MVWICASLHTSTLRYAANGAKLDTKFKSPFRTITYLGHMINGALIDVAPIAVERKD